MKWSRAELLQADKQTIDFTDTRLYGNGWLALTLASVEDEQEYIVLSVNLEEMDALGLPNRTFSFHW